jgi:predicted dehydrogenase
MTEKIRVGCIGCGGKAHHHLTIIKQETPEIELQAYADIRKEAAEKFLSEFGGEYATDDGQKILEDKNIGAVMICTRHDSHAHYAINAAKNRKNIFIEKPLALTIEECLDIERAIARYGVYFQLGFQNRFESRIQKVKEVIKYPIALLGRFVGGCWSEQIWAWDKVAGGGYILSAGCHLYDLISFLSGSQPVEVFARGANYYHPGDDRPDTVTSTIKFANGAVATILCGDCNGGEMDYLLEVYNGAAGASISNNFNQIKSWGVTIEDNYPPGGAVPHTGVVGQWKTFVDRIQNGGISPVTARDGTFATALVLKSFESIRTGQPIPINL